VNLYVNDLALFDAASMGHGKTLEEDVRNFFSSVEPAALVTAIKHRSSIGRFVLSERFFDRTENRPANIRGESAMTTKLHSECLDQLFLKARTHKAWTDRPVSDQQLRELYELLKMGPTSANTCPTRFVWVKSAEGKSRLAVCAMPTNQSAILAAPVTVIVGFDLDFAEKLPELFPSRSEALKAMFTEEHFTYTTAFRNGSLQGAYLILAARALGLDCHPMSGFDNDDVDREFFAETRVKSNFICSIGYGSGKGMSPRNPRLSFEAASREA
jgi:3-hydroxypropanoate dehydrogenase